MSLQELVAESGYFENRDGLSVEVVRGFLSQNRELVDQWFCYSEDKRTSGGWYIVAEGDWFVVGRINGPTLEFRDRTMACAEFVVREIGAVSPPR